ncbi:hypothetical protein DPMN_006228 [Dreissena polymorpha]|uniref:Uncharacterized protein n=1 Tax=Dreissena polymorpha TaxID=45954 RepID=A0A9D4MV15_DREPO|nr:hypothetical protein DPMN_006228 [Dreissena polymorpha]
MMKEIPSLYSSRNTPMRFTYGKAAELEEVYSRMFSRKCPLGNALMRFKLEVRLGRKSVHEIAPELRFIGNPLMMLGRKTPKEGNPLPPIKPILVQCILPDSVQVQ